MLFNSFVYLAFFTAVTLLYYLMPHRIRWILLLISSYYFYMSWNPKLVVLILFTTGVSWLCARGVEAAKSRRRKKQILVLGITLCLTCLFFFKYYNFFGENLAAMLRAFSLPVEIPALNLILPVGISFYTFQTLSYIVDVYRGDLSAEKHFGIYMLYVSFFPQLVAGPIERATNLLPQLHREHTFDLIRAREGARLMAWGFFKKVVVADTLAAYVNCVYNDIGGLQGPPILLATLFFAMQIYCDFSGYSDIAIGSAKILGIDLMTNFRSPYFSQSIREFWRRWHISLSGWFTDYIYIPLGGSRVALPRQVFNLLVVFFCSGMWHGASWTFVLWGVYHGLLRALELFTEPVLKRAEKKLSGLPQYLFRAARVAVTFALVCFSWIFFRANSISDLIYAVTHLFEGLTLSGAALVVFKSTKTELLLLFAMMGTVLIWDLLDRNGTLISKLEQKGFLLRNAVTWLIVFCVLLRVFTAQNTSATDFIYFQF